MWRTKGLTGLSQGVLLLGQRLVPLRQKLEKNLSGMDLNDGAAYETTVQQVVRRHKK
jgi:hypothetical protein